MPHLLHFIQLSPGFCASGQRTGLWLSGVPHSGQHISYPFAYFSVISAIVTNLLSFTEGAEIIEACSYAKIATNYVFPIVRYLAALTVLAPHHRGNISGGDVRNSSSQVIEHTILRRAPAWATLSLHGS